jgi:hypothetical protein
MELHKAVIVANGNDIVIYNGVSGSPSNDDFSFIEEIRQPIDSCCFSCWTNSVEIMDISCKRLVIKSYDNILDGHGVCVSGNEGVRNYLLKLGIKEHE